MMALPLAILTSLGCLYAVLGFLLFRNAWVCRVRIRLIWNDYAAYDRLPSYDAMLWRFWVWRVSDFHQAPSNTHTRTLA